VRHNTVTGAQRRHSQFESKLLIRFGVPREFQLEHPAKTPENAGFTPTVLQLDLESVT
jgi:hypothetical protein